MAKNCRTGCVSRIFNRLHAQRSVCKTIASASYIRVVSYLVSWLFSLFWAQCAHAQLNPFYPDVTHVRKDTREQSRSAFQSSNPIGQFIIHIYMHTRRCPTTPSINPNPTLITPNPTNQIRALKRTLVL